METPLELGHESVVAQRAACALVGLQLPHTLRLDRRRWAALIKYIYQADPLLCPQCGGTMKIIAFIEAPSDPGITHEVDPDFLEHLRREPMDQPELPWEP